MDRFLVVDDSQSWRSYHIDNLKDIYKSEIFIDEAFMIFRIHQCLFVGYHHNGVLSLIDL